MIFAAAGAPCGIDPVLDRLTGSLIVRYWSRVSSTGVRLTAGRGRHMAPRPCIHASDGRDGGDRVVKRNICATTACLRPECASKSNRETKQSVFLRVLLLRPSSGRDWLTAPLTSPPAAAAAASASPPSRPARARPLNLPLPPTPPSIHPHDALHSPPCLSPPLLLHPPASQELTRAPVTIGRLVVLPCKFPPPAPACRPPTCRTAWTLGEG